MYKKVNKNKGFTLIEMVVSLAIFTVVALVAVGALLKVMDANRKALTLKTAINNINFALESFSREMRVGKDYFCSTNLPSAVTTSYTPTSCNITTGDWKIVFKNSSSDDVNICLTGYMYSSGTLKKATASCNNPLVLSDYQELISPDITILSFNVNVVATVNPSVFLSFRGYAGVYRKSDTEFLMQTRVSQRIR